MLQHLPSSETVRTLFPLSYPLTSLSVSGIYVEFPFGGILLDCGEGTLGQMYRLFGSDVAKVSKSCSLVRRFLCSSVLQKILNLKIVFLTHHHADHFCGVTRVLSYKKQVQFILLRLFMTSLFTLYPY